MKNRLFLLLSLLLCPGLCMLSQAQFQKNPVNFPSPNVASLGAYGEIPVSLYTGLPQISIPLYTLTEGSIQVPLSLSYHASGVRPDQHPGWTGTNWSLSAGGHITRKVNAGFDELNGPIAIINGDATYEGSPYYGYYFNQDYTNKTNWDTKDFLTSLAMDVYLPPSNYLSPYVFKDSAPDEFNFQFLNYSGTFYLNHLGKWQVRSDYDIKVEFNNQFVSIPFKARKGVRYTSEQLDDIPTFAGFTLITEDGTRYDFGNTGNTDAIEYSTSFFQQNISYWTATTWHLTKITETSGKSVTFSYGYRKETVDGVANTRYDFVCSMFNSLTQLYWIDPKPDKDGGLPPGTCIQSAPSIRGFNFYFEDVDVVTGLLIAPVYLEKIETSSSQITVALERAESKELRYEKIGVSQPSGAIIDLNNVFELFQVWKEQPQASNRLFPYLADPVDKGLSRDDYPNVLKNLVWRKLTHVRITDGRSQPIDWQFNYNDELVGNQEKERLTLMTVRKNTQPPYQFTYHPTPLPNRYLEMYSSPSGSNTRVVNKDHWGFYKGDANFTLNQAGNRNDYAAQLNLYAALKNPSESYMMAGTLTDITYPTGGNTHFTYEPHRYAKGLKEIRDALPLDTYANNTLAGGLRIRKITSTTNDLTLGKIEKEYFYVHNYDPDVTDVNTLPSSGILAGKSKYHWTDYVGSLLNQPGYYHHQVFSIQSVMPGYNSVNGSHIGYSEVVEKLSDGSYTINTYTNFDDAKYLDKTLTIDNTLQASRTAYDPYVDKSFVRGQLLSSTMHTATGNPVKKTINQYKELSADFCRGIFLTGTRFCNAAAFTYTEGFALSYPTFKFKLLQADEYVYDQQDDTKFSLSSSTYNFTTDGNGLISEVVNTLSNGNELRTNFKYPADVYKATSGVPLDGPSKALQKMTNLHMTGTIVEKQIWEKPYKETTYRLIEGSFNTFKEFNTNKIFPNRTYLYRMLAPVTTASTTATEVVNGKLAYDAYDQALKDYQGYEGVETMEYDSQGNMISLTRDNDVSTAYLWGYKASRPIAQVKNAKATQLVTQIDHTSFEEETDAARFSTDSKTGRKSLKVSYTVPLPSAGTYQLTYWRKSTAPNSKWELISESFSVADKVIGGTGYLLDEIRVYPRGAEMSTYTYDPLVGITSATDANNITTYYEYDGLQRLQYLKDQDGNIVKSYVYHYK